MTRRPLALLSSVIALPLASLAHALPPHMNTQQQTLWMIGEPDGSAVDLALDVADFVKYPTQNPTMPPNPSCSTKGVMQPMMSISLTGQCVRTVRGLSCLYPCG